MFEQHFLDDCHLQLRKLKAQADGALGQVNDAQFFQLLDPEANSIAIVMKHVAGNMRSRWTDFLTSDGEKPNRGRDDEFIVEGVDDRAHVTAVWEDGWRLLLETIASLKPEHLGQKVRIRGEAHTVVEAINRQMTHYAAHVGQIVLLAKHYTGSNWKTLSIPRGASKTFDVGKSGSTDGVRK